MAKSQIFIKAVEDINYNLNTAILQDAEKHSCVYLREMVLTIWKAVYLRDNLFLKRLDGRKHLGPVYLASDDNAEILRAVELLVVVTHLTTHRSVEHSVNNIPDNTQVSGTQCKQHTWQHTGQWNTP